MLKQLKLKVIAIEMVKRNPEVIWMAKFQGSLMLAVIQTL